jgi:hypothetical protein
MGSRWRKRYMGMLALSRESFHQQKLMVEASIITSTVEAEAGSSPA